MPALIASGMDKNGKVTVAARFNAAGRKPLLFPLEK